MPVNDVTQFIGCPGRVAIETKININALWETLAMKGKPMAGKPRGPGHAAALFAALLGLAACEPTTTAVVAGASLASLIHTDKTLMDHAASYATDEDCSILHSAHNEAYCQAYASEGPDPLLAMTATHYCYRTLGGVSCYDRPDYTASSETRIEYAYGFGPSEAAAPVAALPAPAADRVLPPRY
jgi:hypothetical protein